LASNVPITGESPPTQCVVVADDDLQRRERLAALCAGAGHDVAAAAPGPEGAADAVARHEADLTLVGVGGDALAALRVVETVRRVSPCPIVVLVEHDDPGTVRAALARGADAFADRATAGALESAFALAWRSAPELARLRRQVQALEAQGRRRARIELAKGVLMERHDVDEQAAYGMLRTHSRNTRTPVAEVADAVLDARALLRPGPRGGAR
jgi:AmiR/NasT family two-component response regulator